MALDGPDKLPWWASLWRGPGEPTLDSDRGTLRESCAEAGKLPRLSDNPRRAPKKHTRRLRTGFQVANIVVHPQYDKPSFVNNDIALIKLNRPAILNRQVSLVCLPYQGYNIPAERSVMLQVGA
ncbi:hypothetical protein OS493_005273 [Desmophyllum pertusum]|uniref:Peptidase S1 domain-containing protein n=1 Tax=Desmophyllum pertusum TaxID=174260 RepID=A0A9W9Z4N1_9CNID|nr:hypothetical protein OS493_005273 [Desmophyllum pertusum]